MRRGRPTRTSTWSTCTPVTSTRRRRRSSLSSRTWVAHAGSSTSTSNEPCSSRTGRTWAAIGRADGLLPATEHAADLGPPGATAQRPQQPVERVGHRHRLVAHDATCGRTRPVDSTPSRRSPADDRLVDRHGAVDDAQHAVGLRRRRHRRCRRDHDLTRRQVTRAAPRPTGVELGQHVVEHEHRGRPGALGHQPVGAEPQRRAPACAARPARRASAPAAVDRQRRARRGAARRSTRHAAGRRRGPRRARRPGRRAATAGRRPARRRSAGRRGGRRPRRRTGGCARRACRGRGRSARRPRRAGRPTRRAWSPHRSSSRPPTWRSSVLRWRTMRSSSRRSGVVLHRQRDERVVEEAAAIGRATLDEREVVGREHRHPHHTEQVAGAVEALAVDLHAVAPGRHQLGLDQRRPPVVVAHLGAHDRRRRARRARARPAARRGSCDSVAR